jgi:hypothetical protein
MEKYHPKYLEILNKITSNICSYLHSTSYQIQLSSEIDYDLDFDINVFSDVIKRDIESYIVTYVFETLNSKDFKIILEKSKNDLMIDYGVKSGIIRFMTLAFFDFFFLYFVFKNKEFKFKKKLFELMKSKKEISTLIGYNEVYNGNFSFLNQRVLAGDNKCPFLFFMNKDELLQQLLEMSESIFLCINKKLENRYLRFPDMNDETILFLMGKLNID